MTITPLVERESSSAAAVPSAPPEPAPSAAYHIFLNRRYFPLLDGLRCLSIVAVVWHHAAGGNSTAGVLSRGDEGVSLFFVISGFLITTLLLREQSATGDISLKKFYLRRAFRIFPLYYAVLALYIVLVFLVERQSAEGDQFWRNLPYFLTYTSNWFVQLDTDRVIFLFAWSLATEEQFYVFWPWIVKSSVRRHAPLATMAVLLVLYYGAVFAVASGALDTTWFFTRVLINLSPPICLGVIAALLIHRPTTFRWIEPAIGWRWSAAAALATTLVALAFDAIPSFFVYLSMTWLVAACALRPDHQPLSRLFTSPLVTHIGVVSYGIYLMHILCINLVRRLLDIQEGHHVFFVALVLSVAVATLSYRFFETPFLRLKDKIAKRPERPQTTEARSSGY